LLQEFLADLDPSLAEVLRNCVAIAVGRSGRPHGTETYFPDEGVIVFLDGAMLLMFADILGHAMSLVSATEQANETRLSVARPAAATIRAAASIIWSFRQPNRGFNLDNLPVIGTDPYRGEPAFGKFLWFGERFLLGHELWHALMDLGQASEAPGVRDLIRGSVEDIPETILEDWVVELSADIGALNLVAMATPQPERKPVAVTACLIAMAFLHLLQRTVSLDPQVPYPLNPDDVAHHFQQLRTHPPAEMRIHALEQAAAHLNADIRLGTVYRHAIDAIAIGLDDLSSGCCIAPIGTNAWCGARRGPTGWFCQDHGSPE
jgi:hypothetical protein